jgi:predicted ATP-grasp superfamily ATP-dependent carboligase
MQPYIKGKAMSLSCLFYYGEAYFICCNEQHVQIEQQQFVLTACTVHVQAEQAQQYQQLCSNIAAAIPELFGYVGIDFIQTDSGEYLILEINPRLTSSYAGIQAALGINIAAQVLRLANNEQPILIKRTERQIRIDMNNGTIDAR